MRTSRKSMENSSFFHIMVQGINKEFIFNNNENKEKYLKLINKNKENVDIIAYCIMDNHAHILSKVAEVKNMQILMRRTNTAYARYYNESNNRVGYVFRNRYKTQSIKNEKHLFLCADYIHDNPVKAKICTKREDYLFSSYVNMYNGNQDAVRNQIKQLIYENEIHKNHNEILEDDDFEFMDETKDENESKEIICQNIIDEILAEKGIIVEQLYKENDLLAQIVKRLKDEEFSYRIMAKCLGISREKLRYLIK